MWMVRRPDARTAFLGNCVTVGGARAPTGVCVWRGWYGSREWTVCGDTPGRRRMFEYVAVSQC